MDSPIQILEMVENKPPPKSRPIFREVSHHFQPPKDPLGAMLSQHAVER